MTSGPCVTCAKITHWHQVHGWVFHVEAKHWRCDECGCATEAELYLPADVMEAEWKKLWYNRRFHIRVSFHIVLRFVDE